MAELLTKRTIECVDQDVSRSPTEDMCRSKRTKWDSGERNVDIDGQTPKQDEDRNNSNAPTKVKVTLSEVSEHFEATVSNPIPYRIVVGENCKNRNFDDEAQKASNILKNIVMEKMNDKMADEPTTSMFQGIQQHNYQPMVPLTCKTSYSRPALPVRYLPAQSNMFPPFVRGPNISAFGNLTSQPQTGFPRVLQQSGRFVVQPIPPMSSVVRSLPSACGMLPTATVIPPSTGTATQSTGTMTSINDPSLPSTDYFSKISSSAIKTPTVQVMPGTSMIYKTPGATFKNRNGKVKRPMNAFMVWARNYRSQLSEEMPQASNAQISVRLGQIWGSMSLVDKEKYFREAERIKLQHNRDFPGWVYQPKQKKVPVETQHDRLWARFGSNKEQLPESTTNSCPEVAVTSVQQTVTPTPVTVYPKTPIATTANISITSPLPSFSQLAQTVSDPTPIMSLEAGLNPNPSTIATIENTKSGSIRGESTDGGQGSVRRPTAFKVVGNSQAPAVQMFPKKEHEQLTSMTSSTVGNSPLKITTSCPTATGNVRSMPSTLTGCPSPKGRPPSISRRIPATPAMLVSSQRAYKEAILTKNHSSSPTKSKSSSSGPSLTTTSDQRQQKSDVTPLTTACDVTPTVSQRSPRCADSVDELWPFPLPTIEQTHHADVLYDDHLRYERESGPGYIDPYNPFYYDGSYDETRSGLQVDVNSWQKYLNYTKMQNEAEDKTNLTKYFPPTSSSSVWCEQISNNADNCSQQATHSKQNGNDQEPRRTSSESCFASSLTSAINVLDDVNNGGTPDGYADLNLHGYQNKSPRTSRDVVELQSQNCALQALDLSSGSRAQTSVSNIVYLGQETTHMGSGDGVKTVYIEGSPPGKPEDSRPLKKRTERYKRDFINGGSDFTSGDIPTGTYLEDVVFLTSPEKACVEGLSRNLPQGSGYVATGRSKDHVMSPKLIIDVGHDFVQSLKSGTVITDLTPVDLSNAKSVQARVIPDPATSQIHDTTQTTGRSRRMDTGIHTETFMVSIKKEQDNY
ncbi:uncharacterized protein LOC117339373 [Pecten maximus]|uniref:uncharacterized protein LOC117339373 n=1 Tax=Pecten maximus TaxID=6579 RepID=UPI0014580DE2|nr:uncharacterized protein LOC117339373 [Pecten maximus]